MIMLQSRKCGGIGTIFHLVLAIVLVAASKRHHTESRFESEAVSQDSPDLFQLNTRIIKSFDIHESKHSTATFNSFHHFLRKTKCMKKGKHACTINCAQRKILYRDGCCKCKCRKNFALVGKAKCLKAHWANWSSWNKCIKTEWGGLQTRERICQTGNKLTPARCSGRGSLSRTCSPITAEFRIRKDLRDLTDEELHDLLQAMTKFKKDKSKKGYQNIVKWHGWPGRCPWYSNIPGHGNNHCSWHHHPLFFPWHRLITIQLELGLQQYLKNKTFGIPFWDWTNHAIDLPYILRHSHIYDPILKKYVSNPFYRSYIKQYRGRKLYSQRQVSYSGELMDKYLLRGTVRGIFLRNYPKFLTQMAYNPHDQIHNCLCQVRNKTSEASKLCLYSMRSVDYAAFDPIFLFHHSAIDRIFSMRRRLYDKMDMADWTRSRVTNDYLKGKKKKGNDYINSFDWPLSPFCNKSMNPEEITYRADVWTLHKSYYEEQLFGYKYANYNLGPYSWKTLQRDFYYNVKKTEFWKSDRFSTALGKLDRRDSLVIGKEDGYCVQRYSETAE